MMIKIKSVSYICRIFLIFFIGFVVFACASIHKASEPKEEITKAIDPVDEIGFTIIRHVASNYYSYPDKRKINIKIDRCVSNVSSTLLLGYFRNGIEEKLENANQIILKKHDSSALDAKIEIDIFLKEPDIILVSLGIIDAKTSIRIHTEQQQFFLGDIENFSKINNINEILEFDRRQPEQPENAFVTVKAEFLGTTFKEKDRYFVNTRYNVYGDIVERWVSKYDTGYSGYYPVDMKVDFGGKEYVPDHNYIMFEGPVSPGRFSFIASFRGGRWDNITRQQSAITGEYQKRFMVDIKEGDRLRIDIAYGFSGSEQAIIVKVSRVKTVYREGKMHEQLEIIEVFR